MTKREQAWIKRKKIKKSKYNEHYEKFGMNRGDIWERNPNVDIPLPFTKESDKRSEEFVEKYGRSWWYFTGWSIHHSSRKKEPYWVEQFMVKSEEDNE